MARRLPQLLSPKCRGKRRIGWDTRVSIDAVLLMHTLAQMITALATGHDSRARLVLCMFIQTDSDVFIVLYCTK